MRISYTPEQEELRRELRSYFAKLITPERREALNSTSGEVVLTTLLGGLGTVFGPAMGALVVTSMENYLAQFGAGDFMGRGVQKISRAETDADREQCGDDSPFKFFEMIHGSIKFWRTDGRAVGEIDRQGIGASQVLRHSVGGHE